MEQKLIFFDIDGTLIDNSPGRPIPDSTVQAVQQARAAGHLVYINSGRSWVGIDPRVRAMGFDGFVCGCGAYVREGEEVLFHRTLDKAAQRQIFALVHDLDLQVMYEGAHGVFFDQTRPMERTVLAEKAYYAAMGLDTDRDPRDDGGDFDKLIILTADRQALAGPGGFFETLRQWFDIIDREGRLVEFVPRGCSKGTGMELLLKRHGRTKADCIAFGDSLNDRPMFEAAGTSVAMGNSDPRLLPSATMVTASVMEDGIARALQQLGLTG